MGRAVCVLVFGEDGNDTSAVRELVLALRPEHDMVQARRSPTVLVKGLEQARERKNIAEIAAVVKAEERRGKRCVVVTHRDCDETEPAHQALALKLEDGLHAKGVEQVVAAVPAWEIEAWWFLWPDAVVAVDKRWRKPIPPQPSVGMIPNAKEAFRRALRPSGKGKRPKEYSESDSPKIAAKVRELGIIDQLQASSASFLRFADGVRKLKL